MPSLNTQYGTFRAPNCNPLIPGSWGHKILELLDVWSREHWGTFDMVPLSNHMNLWYSRPRNQNPAHNTVSLPAGELLRLFSPQCVFWSPLIQMCVQRLPPVCIWHMPSEPNPNTLPACYCQMSACRQRVSPPSLWICDGETAIFRHL